MEENINYKKTFKTTRKEIIMDKLDKQLKQRYTMDKFDLDTLHDFTKLAKKKAEISFKHPDWVPGLLEELACWADIQASDRVIEALGVIMGQDYLHFVPESVLKKLPIDHVIGTDLYDYYQCRKAVQHHADYPARMSLRDLLSRAKETYAVAERIYNINHHIKDGRGHIINFQS